MYSDLKALRPSDFIPHGPGMSLLEYIEHFDDVEIMCTTRSHRALNNPLRRDGALHAVHSLEYAGQAIAVHNSLCAAKGGGDKRPVRGYLAQVRDLWLGVAHLDKAGDLLRIRAQRVFGVPGAAAYDISAHSDVGAVMSGRVTVALTGDRQ